MHSTTASINGTGAAKASAWKPRIAVMREKQKHCSRECKHEFQHSSHDHPRNRHEWDHCQHKRRHCIHKQQQRDELQATLCPSTLFMLSSSLAHASSVSDPTACRRAYTDSTSAIPHRIANAEDDGEDATTRIRGCTSSSSMNFSPPGGTEHVSEQRTDRTMCMVDTSRACSAAASRRYFRLGW
eukprot:1314629-Rhodomonas_salina.3